MNKLKEFFYPVSELKIDALKCFLFWFWIALLAMWFSISLQWLPQILSDRTGLSLKIYLWSIWFFAAIVISLWFLFRKSYSKFEETADYLLVEKYLKKLVLIKQLDFEKVWSGRFIEILTSGVNTRVSFLMTSLISLPISFFIISLWTANIFLTDYRLWIATIVFLTILLIILTIFNKKMIWFRLKSKECHTEIVRRFVRIIESRNETLFSNSILDDLKILRGSYDTSIYWAWKTMDYIEWMFWSGRIFIWIIRLFSVWMIWFQVINGNSDIWKLMSIIVSIWIMDQTLTYFIDNYKNLVRWYPNIKKLWTIFDESAYFTNYDTGNDFIQWKWEISFNNVTFSYGEKKVFENFNISFEWGKKTALVWRSGWGKTTIVKLLLWLIEPNNGNIIVDGQVISETKLNSFFKNVWYLSQDPGIFDWTVKENLNYWNWDVSEEIIETALLMAECQFVYELEKGLDTEIGERWIMLSGWQKQRLAMAKIFLKNPEIIVLDEPTSALDSYSEDKITKALHNISENKTVIVIAHRLQTVKDCDRIIVIGDGKVLEEWTHNELIKKNWHYSGMVDLQSWNINE